MKLYLPNHIILLTGINPHVTYFKYSITFKCVCCIPQLPHKNVKYYFLRHKHFKFLKEAKHYGMNSIKTADTVYIILQFKLCNYIWETWKENLPCRGKIHWAPFSSMAESTIYIEGNCLVKSDKSSPKYNFTLVPHPLKYTVHNLVIQLCYHTMSQWIQLSS